MDEILTPEENAKIELTGAVFLNYEKIKLLRINLVANEELTKGTYYSVGTVSSDKIPTREMTGVVWNGVDLHGILLNMSGLLRIKPLTANLSKNAELKHTFIYLV